MQLLERNIEAYTYYELAQAILECELGPNHERYLTVCQEVMIGQPQYNEGEALSARTTA